MGQDTILEQRNWVPVDQISFHVDDISHVDYYQLYPKFSGLTL
jgi:hypothetical protein